MYDICNQNLLLIVSQWKQGNLKIGQKFMDRYYSQTDCAERGGGDGEREHRFKQSYHE